MLRYGRYILGVCRQYLEKHCGHLKQFLSTDSQVKYPHPEKDFLFHLRYMAVFLFLKIP